ncbi:MAG: hypothetical protein ACYSTJ_04490 [Planctomycetota bacterium]|jgi:hypothetical protein
MISIKRTSLGVALILLGCAAAADYDANDFAAEVVSYTEGAGVGFDPIDFEFYNQPATALGRPTLETTGDMDIGPNVPMPVVPVYPAWRSFELVTIGSGGELVLGFNHRVGDDQNNPYGVDFIVFGNARWRMAGGASWTAESDPEAVTVDSTLYKEPGMVSVSQDGLSWYSFAYGLYADDFAPTAAYRWEDANDVWTEELDPTLPLDPNLGAADFDGNSVAEIIAGYNGSAGGTGFDIKGLDPNDYAALAVDANTGGRWIKYVKIENDPCSPGTPEIDAISDVSCCGDYKHPLPEGDSNADCRVDFFDFAIVAGSWSDMSQISIVAEHWLECSWRCD